MNKHHAIFLNGFRATGKSTVGPLVAKKLGWTFIEMDKEIVNNAGKTIDELTKQGTEWLVFRRMEHELFKNLLTRKNIVVSTGGGLAVNSLFGEQNKMLMLSKSGIICIVLTAADDVIKIRIRETEQNKVQSLRPILDEKKAREIKKLLEHLNGQQKRQLQIPTIVHDSMKVFKQRKPLYQSLSQIVIDTGRLSVEETVKKILENI